MTYFSDVRKSTESSFPMRIDHLHIPQYMCFPLVHDRYVTCHDYRYYFEINLRTKPLYYAKNIREKKKVCSKEKLTTRPTANAAHPRGPSP